MDAAKVDQADSMYKNLNNLRQSLDRCDEGELEKVVIDNNSNNINEKMED